MYTAVSAAITPLQMILLRKYNKALFIVIKVGGF